MRCFIYFMFLLLSNPLSGAMVCELIKCCEDECCEGDEEEPHDDHTDPVETASVSPCDAECCSLCDVERPEANTSDTVQWHAQPLKPAKLVARLEPNRWRESQFSSTIRQRHIITARAGPRLHVVHCIWTV